VEVGRRDGVGSLEKERKGEGMEEGGKERLMEGGKGERECGVRKAKGGR